MPRKNSNVIPFRRPFRAVPLRRVKNRPRGSTRKQASWAEAFVEMRPWLLGIALATAIGLAVAQAGWIPAGWSPTGVAAAGAGEASTVAQPEGEMVDAYFGRCDDRPALVACVIDGDTLRLGERRVRLVGFDTAEKDARCAYEAELAEDSTAALQFWLNRGPFVMQVEGHLATDRYDRELRTLLRMGADGREDRLADYMRQHGGARAYDGGARGGWC